MRVTKAIRDYVTEEIQKKYHEKIDTIGAEYEKQKEEMVKQIEEIAKRANAEAIAFAAVHGYAADPSRYPYREDLISMTRNNFEKLEEFKAICDERSEWRKKMDQKVRQVLFDLEVGETGKAELKDILAGITVD